MEDVKYYKINIHNYDLEINKKKIENIRPIIEKNTFQLNDKNYLKFQALIDLANYDNLRLDISKPIINDQGNVIVKCRVIDNSLEDNNIIVNLYGGASCFENNESKELYIAIGLAQKRAIASALKIIYTFLITYLFRLEFYLYEEIL